MDRHNQRRVVDSQVLRMATIGAYGFDGDVPVRLERAQRVLVEPTLQLSDRDQPSTPAAVLRARWMTNEVTTCQPLAAHSPPVGVACAPVPEMGSGRECSRDETQFGGVEGLNDAAGE